MNGRLMNRLLSFSCAVIVAQSIHGMEQKAVEPAAASAGPVRQRFEIQPSCYALPSEPSGYYCVSGDGRPHSAGILCLPLDVVEHISSYLSLKDIAALRGSCKQFVSMWDHERELRFNAHDLKGYARRGEDEEWLRIGLIHLSSKLQSCYNPIMVNLSNVALDDLPEGLESLRHLKNLDLSFNYFSQEVIKKLCRLLPGLEELNLESTCLTDFPEEIQELRHLKKLGLGGMNRLSRKTRRCIRTWLPGTYIEF